MCGIVGYIGDQEAVPVLIRGLERLEYRGYDSAGIACLNSNRNNFFVRKERGKIGELKARLKGAPRNTHSGIGHTRWATHGVPSKANAHPHLGNKGRIALVHNGIIENHAELKSMLRRSGSRFKSDTDTEAAAHLIEFHYRGDLAEAMRRAAKQIKGFFAFVAIAKDDPDRICALKRSNPLVIGVGDGENFIASDVSALLPHTKKVIYLADDELVELTRDSVKISNLNTRKPIKKSISNIPWSCEEASKAGYAHFMLKEIYEQPVAVANILKAQLKSGEIVFDTISSQFQRKLKRVDKIHFVSCGTAYHAGLVGNYMIGESVHIPTEATVSSEFRYEDPAIDERDLVILITQSGETADTLAALREAKKRRALTLAIVNVVGSTVAREADSVIYTHAGPEIGVASTKAYLAQLTVTALFSLYFGQIHRRGKLSARAMKNVLNQLTRLPNQIEDTLKGHSVIDKCARQLYRKTNFIYLGRGYNFPTALEGALKLKEITYAHAHGYAAGEMKHGPIALIDSSQPVICLCPSPSITYDKMLSNLEEVKARNGIIISIASKGDRSVPALSKYTFFVPRTVEMLSPILTVIPLQLLAYKIATLNHRDVDQPRNLAKSVTVE